MSKQIIVENVVQAKEEVEKLELEGYSRDNIYIFAHDKDRDDDITDALHTENVGVSEQGFLDSMKNLFQSRGDELRTQMAGAGLTEAQAANAEEILDTGKLVIIANR